MGNSIGIGRKKVKVMKIDGDTFKIKTPARACDVVKDYPGHVLLDSQSVKRFGVRAEPVDPEQELSPKTVYFLVGLPKPLAEISRAPRRARSAVNMSAKDRLECLMLSRRSVSDLSVSGAVRPGSGPVQVKVRLPKAELAKLVEESRDEAEVAEKIIGLYAEKTEDVASGEDHRRALHRRDQWKPELGSVREFQGL
ncbi:hypothetical protein NMG60_11006111 [Bertholletia excelsa]